MTTEMTTTIFTGLTTETIIATPLADAITRHETMRVELRDMYQSVSPRACQRFDRQMARDRERVAIRAERRYADIPADYAARGVSAALGEHTDSREADAWRAFSEMLSEYDRCAALYHLSAIRCGVYDGSLWRGSEHTPSERAVADARRVELGIAIDTGRLRAESEARTLAAIPDASQVASLVTERHARWALRESQGRPAHATDTRPSMLIGAVRDDARRISIVASEATLYAAACALTTAHEPTSAERAAELASLIAEAE